MIKDNGGPAFPVSDVTALEPRTTAEMVSLAHGISLRDYFAAKFMSGVMASASDYQRYEEIANDAYRMADAMLAEREK